MADAGQRSRLFGTDGVRGVAGRDLTARLALDLSAAAAAVLGSGPAPSGPSGPPVAVVGRDPRASGEFLEAAVVAGLAGAGVDVLRLGVIPTPGVAYLTGALDAAFGVVISASHNPAPDNGIKFFGRGGVKLPDATEDAIEGRPQGGPVGHGHGIRPGQRGYRGARAVPGPPAGDAAGPAAAAAGRAADRGRLRARRRVPDRPAGAAPGRRGGYHDGGRPGRPEHQRGLRLHRPGPAVRGGGRARRGRGHRLRRGRRPVPRGRRGRAAAGRRPDHDHPGRRAQGGGGWPATRWWSR